MECELKYAGSSSIELKCRARMSELHVMDLFGEALGLIISLLKGNGNI